MNELFRKLAVNLEMLRKNKEISLGKPSDVTSLPCGYKEMGAALPDATDFKPFDTEHDFWGNGTDTHAWFHFFADVPDGYEAGTVFLRVSTGYSGWDPNNPQFIAYVDGKLKQGLDINHTDIFFDTAGRHEIYLYAYTGITVKSSQLSLELFAKLKEVEKLWYDIQVPFDSLSYLDTDSGEYRKIINALDKALNILDMYELPSEKFLSSVHEASEYMDREFYGKLCQPPRDGDPVVIGIGHTHIDCAWLWTLKQTREKVQRSFSTVTDIMRRYPEYRFMSSQALLYKNLKEEAPDIYEQVRELIKEGRWECEGSMWVEADCNLSSGESLVRQIIYGKRFFKQEFGVNNHILWLPDVFGYSAALPQILRKSDIDWFVTSKISWNEVNKMPYDTFMWKGIDGTGINTYFLTAQDKFRGGKPQTFTTYVAHITPSMASGTYARYQQKELSDETLLTFGFGDGGGGPTEVDLEYAKRLTHGIPGTPAVKIGFVQDFLAKLENNVKDNPRLPVWQGELYLERHRGTYTSQARNKKNNRQCEILYLSTELACSIAKQLLGSKFPRAELHEGWEMILTNQFHDIIPGSSIREVYEQCDKDYETIRGIANPLLAQAENSIAKGIDKKHGIIVYNPNPTVGNGIVKLNGESVYVSNVPAKGYAVVSDCNCKNGIKLSKDICENKYFRLCFDENMQLTSIYDKRNKREVLRKGEKGNQLRVYADLPVYEDAWDWNDFSMDKYVLIDNVAGVETVNDGARAGLRIERKHYASTVVQTIWLYEDIDRIDFETTIDWKQHHHMLKAAFPVDVNSSHATYEIQYGTTERPTHKNTSWDKAKFEVCAHRFADISEGSYGVALLNDCKYGHDIHDGLITLSLLRSPTYPDPEADQGVTSCVYSLYPHSGAADICELYAKAYELNSPMTAFSALGDKDVLPTSYSAVSCDKKNVLCEVVKQAEDGDDTVFRFFECSNSRTEAKLRFGFEVEKCELCNMLEEPIAELASENGEFSLDFGAFEIHTLKVRAKSN